MSTKADFDDFMDLLTKATIDKSGNEPKIISEFNDDITNKLSFKIVNFFDKDGVLDEDVQRNFNQYFDNNKNNPKTNEKLTIAFTKAYDNPDLGINEKLSEFMTKLHKTPEQYKKDKRIFGRPNDTIFKDHKGLQKMKKKAGKPKKEGVLKSLTNAFKRK